MVVARTVVVATEYTEWTETHELPRVWRHTAAARARAILFWEPPLWAPGAAAQEHLGAFLEESSPRAECSVSFRPFGVFRDHVAPFRATNPARTLE